MYCPQPSTTPLSDGTKLSDISEQERLRRRYNGLPGKAPLTINILLHLLLTTGLIDERRPRAPCRDTSYGALFPI